MKIRATSYVLAAAFLMSNALPLFVVPKFAGIFSTMLKGVTLPRLTQAVLDFTPWWWLLMSIGFAVLIVAKDCRKWRLPNALFVVGLIVGILTTVVAMFLPIYKIHIGFA